MGLKCSQDIAQSIIESILAGIDDAVVYIDYIGAFFKNWDHHVQLLATIFCHLCVNRLIINPSKCEWAVKATDYWLTPRGLMPWKMKIEAILHMDRPCITTELCMLIGCINY
jgi:hypothetical protein